MRTQFLAGLLAVLYGASCTAGLATDKLVTMSISVRGSATRSSASRRVQHEGASQLTVSGAAGAKEAEIPHASVIAQYEPYSIAAPVGLLLLAGLAYGSTRAATHPDDSSAHVSGCICVAVGYLACSSAIIILNKYLLHESRFPFPAPLMAFHQLCVFALMTLLYVMMPALFPAAQEALMLQDGEESRLAKVANRAKPFVPIGLLAAFTLLTANYAYLYASVSFLQMIKEGNVVWVYVGSLLCGLETFQWRLLASIVVVFAGAVAAVDGEIHFVLAGLVIQLASSIGEAVRVTYMSWLMSGGAVKSIDPLSFVLGSAPATLLMLSPVIILFWDRMVLISFWQCLPWILLSTALACCLQVLIAIGIKVFSGTGFVLLTILKDVFVVVGAAFVFGDQLSSQQILGFLACTSGILVYSLLKQPAPTKTPEPRPVKSPGSLPPTRADGAESPAA